MLSRPEGLLARGSPYSRRLPIRMRAPGMRIQTVACAGFVPPHSCGAAGALPALSREAQTDNAVHTQRHGLCQFRMM